MRGDFGRWWGVLLEARKRRVDDVRSGFSMAFVCRNGKDLVLQKLG